MFGPGETQRRGANTAPLRHLARPLRDAQLAGIEMLLLAAAICIRRAPWPAHGPDSVLLYAEDEAGTKLGQASVEVSTAAPTG